jgi:Toluene-4-monooxygenase system protein B (TmoB)
VALFPIYGRFKTDFVPHLCPVDTDDDMPTIAAKVAVHSVGRRVAEQPGVPMDVYVDGVLIPESKTLGELGLAPLAWVDVQYRQSA